MLFNLKLSISTDLYKYLYPLNVLFWVSLPRNLLSLQQSIDLQKFRFYVWIYCLCCVLSLIFQEITIYKLITNSTTNSTTAKDFLVLLECFNLTQFENSSIRSKGHTLDLVIANELFDNLNSYQLILSFLTGKIVRMCCCFTAFLLIIFLSSFNLVFEKIEMALAKVTNDSLFGFWCWISNYSYSLRH